MLTWDLYFLRLAKEVASASKDPSTKCGAVIVDSNNRIVSTGFNGFPKNINDSEERLNNRELKYKLVLHAELNAILYAKQDLSNCTLYIWPFQPCSQCTLSIIQSGIKRIVSVPIPLDKRERWQEDMDFAASLLEEAGVDLNIYA